MLGGESISVSDLVRFLDENKEAREIVIDISSNGGYRTEALEMRNRLKNCGKTVYTVGYRVNSAATLVFLAADKKNRLVSESVQFVIHFARLDPMDLGIEALTADDLQELADQTSKADTEILNLYCEELGEENRGQLLAYMADEKDLGPKMAIKLGFASGYYKKKKDKVEEKNTIRSLEGVLITDKLASLIQNKIMADKKDLSEIEKVIQNGFKTIAKFLGAKVKNIVMEVADGTSIEVVPVDPEDETNLIGASVFTVEDGVATTTAAVDGEYALKDGRTIVVAAGKVTEVIEAVDSKKVEEENKTLKEQLTAKEGEINALNEKVKNLTTEQDRFKLETQKQIDAIQNSFKEYQESVPGLKKDKDDDTKPPVDLSKLSYTERLRINRREQRAQQRQA